MELLHLFINDASPNNITVPTRRICSGSIHRSEIVNTNGFNFLVPYKTRPQAGLEPQSSECLVEFDHAKPLGHHGWF